MRLLNYCHDLFAVDLCTKAHFLSVQHFRTEYPYFRRKVIHDPGIIADGDFETVGFIGLRQEEIS